MLFFGKQKYCTVNTEIGKKTKTKNKTEYEVS